MVPSIYLSQLHVSENVNFHHESVDLLEQSDPAQLGIFEQTEEYKSAVNELDNTVDVYSASELAKESTRIDQTRARKYSALKAYVKVMLNDDDEAKVAAAERIISVIRKSEQELGNPLTLGFVKESTALSSLTRNLESMANDIQLIGAEDKLSNLKAANQSFIDLQFDRNIEKSTKHSGDAKAACTVADNIYKNIIARVNAQILLHGEEAFSAYVKAQSAVIEKHKNIVAQRKGRKK
ncbi:MAG: DUF6261 family protein [Prevotellaceae bacterium]|jgi:hypothetical protein|nr:DUF6261 family protein [Prevotellaceae bacterium]